MKFCILCTGSYGDIRPYIALGKGLKQKGHTVKIVTHQPGEQLAKKEGLDFHLLDGDLTESITHEKTTEFLFNKKSKISIIKEAIIETRKNVEKQLMSALAAVTKETEVLIYNNISFAGPHLAEYYKIPSYCIYLTPAIRTTEFPYPSNYALQFKCLGKLGAYLSYHFQEQRSWQTVRDKVNKWRRNVLGIRNVSFFGPLNDPITKKIPIIIPFSQKIVKPPKDWPSNVHMTNFMSLKNETDWTPPHELVNFFDGEKILFLSFGSLSMACPPFIVKEIVKVLHRNRIKSLVNSNLPGLNELQLPSFIKPVSHIPHSWLFQNIQAVVHHCGAGTMAATLQAGLPSMAMPFGLDQFFLADKLTALGIGPSPLPIQFFDISKFEKKVLDLMMNQDTYQKNAKNVQFELNDSRDGVDWTIDVIFNLLNKFD